MEATFDILLGLIKYSSVAISIKGRSRAFRIRKKVLPQTLPITLSLVVSK